MNIQQRAILHQTTAGSVGVGTYSFAVGSLRRFNEVRLLVSAASSALTATFQQQVQSHASVWDVTSGLSITSGAGQTYAVFGDRGLFTLTATSATPLRAAVIGVPVA